MTLSDWFAIGLAAAVVIAAARLVLQHVRSPRAGRARSWRLAVLLALQPLCAGLLYMTLAPPRDAAVERLVVATRHAPVGVVARGDRVVALPEAPALPGIERVPDLATALRRYDPARLRIVGDGLVARDREAVGRVPVEVDLRPAPVGLVGLAPPSTIAAGGAFRVDGRVAGLAKPLIELVDPADRPVATAVPDTAGRFVVEGAARAPGPVSFTLRVRDGRRLVESAEVPVWTTAATAERVLLLAGAAGPEPKFLRRWASDAGMALRSRIAAGAGLALGDAPPTLTAATLKRFDLLVVDERSWTALPPGERATVLGAVRGGLGLLVRIGAPVSEAARGAFRPLGFVVSGGNATMPLALRSAADLVLNRWAIKVLASDATALLHDDRGVAVAFWRAEGTGRIGVWPVADSYRLVLAGSPGAYGTLWAAAFATLGRGQDGVVPTIDRGARVGQRVAICGTVEGVVSAPDGRSTRLINDPATAAAACAGFWPRMAGWHRVQARGGTWPFHVAETGALPNVQTALDRAATLDLAAASAPERRGIGLERRFGPWPWFVAWLVASAGLWWFERAKIGTVAAPTA